MRHVLARAGGSAKTVTSAAAVCVAGLAALAVGMGVGRFAFTPILPIMQADAGVSVVNGAWLAAANYLGYLLGALAAMRMKPEPVEAIRAGLLMIAISTFGMALMDDVRAWLGLRALAGVASAMVLIFTGAWALQYLSALSRSALTGVVFAGVGAGITLVGLLCVAFVHLRISSAGAWMLLGIVSMTVALGIWHVLGPAHDSSGEAMGAGAGLLSSPDCRRLIVAYGAFGFGYIVPATFLPVMAREAIPDPAVFGWSWPIFGAAAMASTVLAASLKRIKNRHLWIAAQATMAIGVAIPLCWSGFAAISLSALLVGGTFMVITMVGIQEAREVAAEHATKLIAAMTSAFACGQLSGPVVVSALGSTNDPFTLSLFTASLSLLFGAYLLTRPASAKAGPSRATATGARL